ncbi:TPA: hypothetical protein QCY71_005048 [Bacillus cereus]|nr:hypothetical protein [Bacillus cereus]
MNMDKINVKSFIGNLTEKTKESNAKWGKVPILAYSKIIDRPMGDSKLKECYFTDSSDGLTRIVIGKYQSKVYSDEYNFTLEDHFFITITDNKYQDPTTFSEIDDDEWNYDSNYSFTLSLSKLYRMIQLQTNNIQHRLDNFFD